MTIETKQLGGTILEVKVQDRNGVPVGIIKGYIATWDLDRGDWYYKDQFVKGAFLKSIREHKKNNNRQIRFKDHHGRTVGGFPIENVKEDEVGLYAEGEVNLEVQQGQELHSLAKQGVIVEFSIGFEIVVCMKDEKTKIRTITEAKVWEGSAVDEPMNPKAVITEVKSNMKMADKSYEWNPDEAIERIKEFTKSELIPSESYGSAFVLFSGDVKLFDSYSLPIVDIIDGEMTVIHDAAIKAAEIIQAIENDAERKTAINRLKPIFDENEIEFPIEENGTFTVTEVKGMTIRELENALSGTGLFSKNASAYLVSNLEQDKSLYTLEEAKLLIDLKGLKKNLSETS